MPKGREPFWREQESHWGVISENQAGDGQR